MQDKTPREPRAPYAGRFAASNGSAPSRGADAVRARAASADDASRRRPSGFAAPEPPRRSAAASTAAAPRRSTAASTSAAKGNSAKAPEIPKMTRQQPLSGGGKKQNSKRSRVKRFAWWKKLLIALAAAALILLLILLLGGRGGTRHQMPRIVRGDGNSYAPEASAQPASGGEAPSQEQVESGAEAQSGGESGEVDWSQYLITPEPGADLSDAAAAAGARLDAANGEAGA